MNRYRIAKAMGERAYIEALKEDSKLLEKYGLKLQSVDGGVHAAVLKELRGAQVHPWNMISINDKTWDWLRPLLVKLDKLEELQMAAK